MFACGQHRNDGFGAIGGGGGVVDGEAPGLFRFVERIGGEIEGADIMPRLCEIRGHPAAHIAEPDKSYSRHSSNPFDPASSQ